MRLKRIFLINGYFNQKGQALVELATFGTILLFCLAMLVNFGLQANYQQEIEMKAFRQAMQQAYNNDSKGPSAGSDVNLIEDKVGINTQDPYGVSERYPFGAGSKVTWNNNIMDEYLDQSNNTRPEYLPQTSYKVNAEVLGPYTTANYKRYPPQGSYNGNIIVRIPLLEKDAIDTDGDGIKDKFWKDVSIDCATQTKIFKDELSKDEPKPLVGYIRNDAEFPSQEKEQISSVLMNGRQKTVVKVEGAEKGPILAFWVLDTQAGQIDTAVEIPINPDGSKDLTTYSSMRQGLWPNYTRTITKLGTMSKAQNSAGITTTTSASSTENIRRWIRLNIIGTPNPINSNGLSTGQRDITWTSPK